jgi:hypothetical protein
MIITVPDNQEDLHPVEAAVADHIAQAISQADGVARVLLL